MSPRRPTEFTKSLCTPSNSSRLDGVSQAKLSFCSAASMHSFFIGQSKRSSTNTVYMANQIPLNSNVPFVRSLALKLISTIFSVLTDLFNFHSLRTACPEDTKSIRRLRRVAMLMANLILRLSCVLPGPEVSQHRPTHEGLLWQ